MKYEKATNVGSKIQSNTTKIENLLGQLRLVSRMLAQKEFTREATSNLAVFRVLNDSGSRFLAS